MKKIYNFGNAIVIALTFVLFTIALFVTGFTKGLLLEAGVLLVSVKIILMNIKNSNTNKLILNKLDELEEKLKKIQNQKTA
jgi:hypothetical protein